MRPRSVRRSDPVTNPNVSAVPPTKSAQLACPSQTPGPASKGHVFTDTPDPGITASREA